MAQSPPGKPDKGKPDKGKKGGAAPAGDKRLADLKLILAALSVFTVTLLITSGLVYLSKENLEKSQLSFNIAQQQRNEARQKLAAAREDERDIHDFLTLFQAFRQHGIVGEEIRLDWVEGLQSTYRKYKLFPIKYEFSPRQTVQLDPSINLAGVELRATQLAIKAELLHEGDLINLLGGLKTEAHNFFSVKECTLTRLGGVAEGVLSAHLDGECVVYWLTMSERSAMPAEDAPPAQ